jgi:putative transposase
VSEKYAFIDAEYAKDPGGPFLPAITRMCRLAGSIESLDSANGGTGAESAAARRRADLAAVIIHVFEDSDGTYGYRRIAAQLARSGIAAGPELVRRLMRELGLVPCQPRPWRAATTVQGQAGPIPDLVNRDFSSDVPGQKMVGDITYIPTWEGWAFLRPPSSAPS